MTQHDPYVDIPEPPLTSAERVMGEQGPPRQRGSVSSSPRLPIRYIFLPGGKNRQVADFWSGLFVGQVSLKRFREIVKDCAERLHYDDVEIEGLSFSGGFVGVERDMLRFDNGRGAAGVYFKQIGGFHYVSLRVYYAASLSIIKLLGLILLALWIGGTYTYFNFGWFYAYYYGERLYPDLGYLLGSWQFWQYSVVAFMGLFLGLGILSWWRTGSFTQFLRQDFNELYRDDLASIGTVAYAAIQTAVDQLSLKAVVPRAENPPPSFGSQVATASRRRI